MLKPGSGGRKAIASAKSDNQGHGQASFFMML
jgi:hypothetical protein